MDNKKVKKVSLRLTREALEIMDKISNLQGVSKTAVVEIALRSLNQKGFKNA